MDIHSELLLEQYKENLPTYKELLKVLKKKLEQFVKDFGVLVNSVEGRVKTLESLTRKLELKGSKYQSINDVTDIVGARVVTFYADEVDKFAAKIEQSFNIDWENTVDKRKIYNVDQFGYMSLHYVCTMPKEMYYDEKFPLMNELKIEIQIRSVLQHTWASIEHDTGYKSDIEIPKEYFRALNRLASLLELADESFCEIRNSLEDYRRRVRQVVNNGKLDEVELNGDSFKAYIEHDGFMALNRRISTINNMEVQDVSLDEFLKVFKAFGFKTLKDLDDFVKEYFDLAYEFSIRQFDGKDIDIISTAAGPIALCVTYIISKDMGVNVVQKFLDTIYGVRKSNEKLAIRLTNIGRSMGLDQNNREQNK